MVWRHWVWLTFRAAHQNHQQELNSSYYTVSTGECWEQDGQNVAGGTQTAHYASAERCLALHRERHFIGPHS